MSTLINDLKYAIRTLRRSPGFTITVVFILALGIGVNTAVFSLINGVLFKTLPVRDPGQLRVICWAGSGISMSTYSGGGKRMASGLRCKDAFSYPLYCDLRDRVNEFSEVFAFQTLFESRIRTQGTVSTSEAMMVSGNFFAGYGTETLIGRPISTQDDRAEANPVAVITYRFWQRHFDLDPHVIGQTLILNKTSFTIVGVLPQQYAGPVAGDPTDVYIPLAAQPQLEPDFSLTSYDCWWIQIMGRLAPQADEAQARASCEVIFSQALAGSKGTMKNPMVLLEDGSRGHFRAKHVYAQPLWMIQALVALVLLIVCANVAGMLLVRGAVRSHEIAVRTALGARRRCLIRSSLIESLILSLGGAAIGLLLCVWIRDAFAHFLARYFYGAYFDYSMDTTVLLFPLGLAIITTLSFGVLPAWRLSCVDPMAGLQYARLQGSPRVRLGKVLVTAQVALSFLLVVVGGRLVRTVMNLQQVDYGFDTEKLLVFQVNADEAGYGPMQCIDYYEKLQRALSTLPGVDSVSFTHQELLGDVSSTSFTIAGRGAQSGEYDMTNYLSVGDQFFSTLKIPLLQGRDFNGGDTRTSAPVVVINDAFAKAFFPDKIPLGLFIDKAQIIGVCGNTKTGLRYEVAPTLYFHHRQDPIREATILVRTVLSPLSLATGVKELVADLDGNIPIMDMATMTDWISGSLALERLYSMLCSSLAFMGLLLACSGLYGLLAYQVNCRTGEIGIRMVLGAHSQDVIWPILRQAGLLAFVGIAIGLPLAWGTGRVMQSVVFGIESYDPTIVLIAALIILVVAILAAWIPASRAARIDPMEALRYE